MIVVFVVDTSPSMGQPLTEGNSNYKERTAGSGMSRLDLAKMAVEDVVRGLSKRVTEHNLQLQQQPKLQSLRHLGLGFSPNDEFLLLSTGRQHTQQPATAACGAGGRLLVGYGDHEQQAVDNPTEQPTHQTNADSFQRELKRLQATPWGPASKTRGSGGKPEKQTKFPEDGGGAIGLNAALSAGLQQLSRYRLSYRATENYGMGRLPSPAVLNPSGGPSTYALQPACVVVITDGVCLTTPPSEGGGSLQLQYGNMPLREFYQEPFRWDQRIFCLGVGGRDGISSTQYLHPHLRALCEVTGGSHLMLRSSANLSQVTDLLLKLIAPPRPRTLPIPDPLRLQAPHNPVVGATGTFVSGGPVCCFQALEGDIEGGSPTKYRAMMLYVSHQQQLQTSGQASLEAYETFQPPVWCIPESFFPSKKLDALPPRSAQPNLLFSRYPARLGSKSFDPTSVMKALHRLDQLVTANRKATLGIQPGNLPSQVKLLSRDVYIVEWVSLDGKPARGPLSPHGMEYFPVLVPGAGRATLSDGEANYLNVGILHIPFGSSTLASSLSSGARLATLTLLPPEPHILLPLLLRAAEAEHRVLKKAGAMEAKDGNVSGKGGATAGLIQKQTAGSRTVHLDDHWRTEFRAYLFRLPPYYQNSLRRSLRPVLPASAHSLLNTDGMDGSLASQCFSKTCLQKIRNAEQVARDTNERLERQEAELRRRGSHTVATPTRGEQHPTKPGWPANQQAEANKAPLPTIGYGQYDPRSTSESFLAAIRNMPAPWRIKGPKVKDSKPESSSQDATSDMGTSSAGFAGKSTNAAETLGDLPANCLMAYYESRRRWIFGGSGLSTRGLFVDGVNNDGSNVQRCGAKPDPMKESLLSHAGVGVSTMNATTTTKMGDYRERLLWSRAPVVGYGPNDSTGVAATNSADGSPKWSVDDDAMPISFFDPKTGEFADSMQARVRSRLMVNFGNPYKDKRADSLVPEKFLKQRPSQGIGTENGNGPLTPPGSPPHDSFSAVEGEGEAMFAGLPMSRKSPTRKSPSRSDANDDRPAPPEPKRQKLDHPDAGVGESSNPEKSKDEQPPSSSSAKPAGARPTKAGGPRGPPPPPPPKGSLKKPPPPAARNPIQARPRPPPPSASGMKQPPNHPTQTNAPTQKPAPPQNANPSGSASHKPLPGQRPNAPPKPAGQKPPAPGQHQRKNSVTQQPPPPPIDMQSPQKKPKVDLPPGWMCVWSKSQKRWYFFDTKSNKSVWEWPPPGGLPK